jgi:Domain of unknown function DUF29
MSDSTLYDDDILLWSEQQAAAIRRLSAGRLVPNDLDIENVAEEIESVGRSELAALESYIVQIFVHLMKLRAEPAGPLRHWRSEIVAFHGSMMRRFAPSMRQRIGLDDLWRAAREPLLIAYEGDQYNRIADLPDRSPFTLDDLIAERIDSLRLLERLQGPATSR